jgi:hypothetical protein
MLTIHELRQEAYGDWETTYHVLALYNPAPESIGLPKSEAARLPFTNTAFKDEVRQRFGDLRRRSTWEQAAIWMAAQGMAQSYLEPYQILGYMVSPTYMNSLIREHYGQQVIEAMLQFPEVIAILKDGLEQVYQHAEYKEERALVEQFIKDGNQLPAQILQPVAA